MRKWSTEEKISDCGGFGDVYKSYQIVDGVKKEPCYAKKRLKVKDQQAIERFKKEVKIAKVLNHPNIIKIVASRTKSEPYFYIMPLYKNSMGKILTEIMGDYNRIRNIFNSIFDGVEYLHNEQVYHRDLKPENILMNSDDDLVISDFGLSLDLNCDSTRLTQTLMRMGTNFYAAPEQLINAKEVDNRTDIFSLGRMIFRCFSKEFINIKFEELPAGIDYVVKKATENNKDDRFSNISDLKSAFNAAIDMLLNEQNEQSKNNFDKILDNIKTGIKSPQFIDKVSKEIQNNKEDSENIHELVMSINTEQYKLLLERHYEITRELMELFKRETIKIEWPFSYTDNIASKCYEFYINSSSNEMKAIFLSILILLGISHNRYYVQNLARKLLIGVDDNKEAFELSQRLTGLKDRIKVLNLNPDELFGELKKLV